METVGTSVVVVLATLLIRDGIPAVIKLMTTRHGLSREDAEDERKARKEEAAEERRTEAIQVRELKELVNVLREDGQQFRQQIHDLRNEQQQMSNEIAICKAERARALERIAAHEEAMDRAGIKYRPYDPHLSNPFGSSGKLPKQLPPGLSPEEEAPGE